MCLQLQAVCQTLGYEEALRAFIKEDVCFHTSITGWNGSYCCFQWAEVVAHRWSDVDVVGGDTIVLNVAFSAVGSFLFSCFSGPPSVATQTSVMFSMTLTALVLWFTNVNFVSAQVIKAKIPLCHKFFTSLLTCDYYTVCRGVTSLAKGTWALICCIGLVSRTNVERVDALREITGHKFWFKHPNFLSYDFLEVP